MMRTMTLTLLGIYRAARRRRQTGEQLGEMTLSDL